MRYHKGKPVKRYRIKEIETGDIFEGEAKECAEFVIKKHPERITGYFDNVPQQIRSTAEINKKKVCYGFEVEELNDEQL